MLRPRLGRGDRLDRFEQLSHLHEGAVGGGVDLIERAAHGEHGLLCGFAGEAESAQAARDAVGGSDCFGLHQRLLADDEIAGGDVTRSHVAPIERLDIHDTQ